MGATLSLRVSCAAGLATPIHTQPQRDREPAVHAPGLSTKPAIVDTVSRGTSGPQQDCASAGTLSSTASMRSSRTCMAIAVIGSDEMSTTSPAADPKRATAAQSVPRSSPFVCLRPVARQPLLEPLLTVFAPISRMRGALVLAVPTPPDTYPPTRASTYSSLVVIASCLPHRHGK